MTQYWYRHSLGTAKLKKIIIDIDSELHISTCSCHENTCTCLPFCTPIRGHFDAQYGWTRKELVQSTQISFNNLEFSWNASGNWTSKIWGEWRFLAIIETAWFASSTSLRFVRSIIASFAHFIKDDWTSFQQKVYFTSKLNPMRTLFTKDDNSWRV
jgi:hypothetical protein